MWMGDMWPGPMNFITGIRPPMRFFLWVAGCFVTLGCKAETPANPTLTVEKKKHYVKPSGVLGCLLVQHYLAYPGKFINFLI